MTRILLCLLLLSAVACEKAPAQDGSLVISSDPELRALAARLLPELAERAGLVLREPIRVERKTREALEEYLSWKLDEDQPAEEMESVVRAYELLGMVPEGFDLRSTMLAVYTEQVAGFYDPDSTTLWVIDDQTAETLEPLMVHELVHAIQDQTVDIDSLTAKEMGNDRQIAAMSVIEGHATLIMLEFMTERVQGSRVDLSLVPDFAKQLRPALAGMSTQFPVLASAPAVLRESLLFPYVEGAVLVQALWQAEGGRPAPFGKHLPLSTEQVLDPQRLLGARRDDPRTLTLVLREGVSERYGNTLGQLGLSIFLEEHLGAAARTAAHGWGGDRFSLWTSTDGSDGLSLAVAFDASEDRDGFLAALRDILPDLDGAVATPVESNGVPVVLVEIGGQSVSSLEISTAIAVTGN